MKTKGYRGENCTTYPTSVRRFPSPRSLLLFPSLCLETIAPLKFRDEFNEKLFWLCNEICAIGGLTDEGAPVNSMYMRARIGMRGSDLLKILIELRLIEKCRNHQAGQRCSRYRFLQRNEKKLINYRMRCPRIIAKRENAENEHLAQLAAAQLPMKLRSDLNHVRPGPKFEDALQRRLVKQRRDGKSTSALEHLGLIILDGRHEFSVNHCRITNEIARLPMTLRALLLVDGRPSVELDLSNSHPCFLAKLFEPNEDSDETAVAEHQRFVRMVRSGKFYEKFMHTWDDIKEVFADYMVGDRTEFLGRNARKGVKLCWQVILNSKGNPARLFATKIWTEFSATYPNISARFAALKRVLPMRIGIELRWNEAKFVANVAGKLSGPCVTIYDGWLCSADNVDELKEICRVESAKYFGFELLPVLKSPVSQPITTCCDN